MKYFNYLMIATAAAASLLALLWPGNTVWLGDEADLLNLALDANEAGVPAARGLQGSVSVFYGALVVWLNQILLKITFNPVAIAGIKSALSIAAAWPALRLLAGEFRIPVGFGAALYFASPFVFFYIRQPWDNVWLMPLGLWFAVFMAKFLRAGSWRTCAGAALTAAAMFYLHPVSTAVPAGFALGVLVFRRPLRPALIRCAVSAGGALILLAPYLRRCWLDFAPLPAERPPFGSGLIAGGFAFRNLTGLGFPERFSPASGAGLWWVLLAAAGLAIAFFALLGVVAVVHRMRRKEELSTFDRATGCAILTALCHMLLLATLRLEAYPHYNSAVVFAWLLIAWRGFTAFSGDFPRAGRRIAAAALLLEFGFLVNFTAVVERECGGGTDFFGCTLGRQWQIARNLWAARCANPDLQVELEVERLRTDPRPLQALIRLARRTPLPPADPYRQALLLPSRQGSGFDLLLLDRFAPRPEENR